jgi:hypothetical protein
VRKPKRAFDRIPATVSWIFVGYMVIINSQWMAEQYANDRMVLHATLNTLRLGYFIIAGAIFDFIYLAIRDRLGLSEIPKSLESTGGEEE